MDVCETAIITANLGEFDKDQTWVPQTRHHAYYNFTDRNLPPRDKAMTPRLQAKIPKCFGWQLAPGHYYYLWLDGNLSLADPHSLDFFWEKIQNYDVVVLKHPKRDSLYWEYRYNWRALHNNAPSNYMVERYTGEWLDEQYQIIKDDKDYVDDSLFNGGVFMYRNTPEVQAMFKEWWYYITRYLIMDQLSWTYVLKKSGLKVNALDIKYDDCRWLTNERHRLHR